MLRISGSIDETQPHFLSIEKKKRQITLNDPASILNATSSQERGPKVASPKIFAFDNLFTDDEAQNDVTASALSEVIPAVLEGTDGCLLTIGYPESGGSFFTFLWTPEDFSLVFQQFSPPPLPLPFSKHF